MLKIALGITVSEKILILLIVFKLYIIFKQYQQLHFFFMHAFYIGRNIPDYRVL
ncbi:hypothetical protein J2S21_000900 [Peribacillus cavernae]|nr:hypothetical protein [Peribacillus cavernae]